MKRAILRSFAIFLSINILVEAFFPSIALALTSGPSQPEVQSFEPVGTTELVDPFSGDFMYNIPLLDVGGYPVNLSYRSLIGIDQESTWTGLGWNINPGVINRTMRGIPDDFDGSKGDKIEKEFNIKPNRTFGVGGDIGIEFLGFEKGKSKGFKKKGGGGGGKFSGSLTFGMGISYNNYKGFGFEKSFNPGINLVQSNKGSLNAGLGLRSSSTDGLSISPSVSYTATMEKNATQERNMTSSLSNTFNSRGGLKMLSMNLSSSDKIKYCVGVARDNSSSSSNGGSTISLGMPTYIPQLSMPFESNSVSLSVKFGGAFFGLDAMYTIRGYYSEQRLSKKHTKAGAYGYFNSEKGMKDWKALHDFNREKDGAFTQNTPLLPLTNYTFDIYAVSGQGVGGMYRPYRGDVGFVYDSHMGNTSNSYTLGLDLAAGNLAKGGADISVSDVFTRSGWWVDDNPVASTQKFASKNQNDLFEPYYFKEAGEKSVDEDPYYNSIGKNHAVMVEVVKKGGLKSGTTNKLMETTPDKSKPGDTYSLDNLIKRQERKKRNQNISFLTVEEATNFSTQKDLYDGNSVNTSKKHHIGEITALRPDGARYIYGIPAYNLNQEEVSFSVGEGKGIGKLEPDASTGLVTYNGGDNSINNQHGLDNSFSNTKMGPYAHSYFLTAVLSPDYIDNDGVVGPSKGDMGTYTRFNYDKTLPAYDWRVPMGTNKANSSEGLRSIDTDDQANYLYGQKEIWYLKSIETKNYIAIFETADRADGLGVTDKNGSIDPSRKLKLLKKISLYFKSEYDKLMGDGNDNTAPFAIKTVNFEYDYSLCPGIDNNIIRLNPSETKDISGFNNQGGKLTLKKIYFTYEKSQKGRFSPYVFTYSKFNPNYNLKANDRWGNYKPFVLSFRENTDFPYVEQNKEALDNYATAWNLTRIDLPSGGNIKVNYESDDYAYVQDKPAMQMFRMAGISNDKDYSTSNRLYINNTHNLYLHINLPKACTSQAFKDYYLKDIKNLYFKASVNMDKSGDAFEYVPGYAQVETEECGVTATYKSGTQLYETLVKGTSCFPIALCEVSCIAGTSTESMLDNGDFHDEAITASNTGTGFKSDYSLITQTPATGQARLIYDANTAYPAWHGRDHTLAANKFFLAVKGETGKRAWYTTVKVAQGSKYNFSAYFKALSDNCAGVTLSMYGTQVPEANCQTVNRNTAFNITLHNLQPNKWRKLGLEEPWLATFTGDLEIGIMSLASAGECYDFGVDDIAFDGLTTCRPSVTIFPKYPETDDPLVLSPCAEHLEDMARENVMTEIESQTFEKTENIKSAYIAKCLKAAEQFTYEYTEKEYHYTLYFYDQAANLTKTLPPAAVRPITDGAALTTVKTERKNEVLNPTVKPAHIFELATAYKYNALNQLVGQHTPDGGDSRFWYDKLGRLVLSQNAKQADYTPKGYSYTKFDALGRIIEVGEVLNNIADISAIDQVNEFTLNSIINAGTRREITRTYYDAPIATIPDFTQTRLRKRVATSTYQDVEGSTYNHATHYSYDIHGNVESLIQEFPDLKKFDQQYKRIDYTFDLVSGKVNLVSYQAGAPDQFYHKYTYDADNRITQVYTSKDGVIWDNDATYKYYAHGPLARSELGDQKVQGMDYVYTLQGWVKGVNSESLNTTNDIGKDGTGERKDFARDAVGFSLGYYNTDYKSIGTSAFMGAKESSLDAFSTNAPNLFNGNISHMVTTLTDPTNGSIKPQLTAYRYDQLNRIKQMRTYQGLSLTTNAWSGSSDNKYLNKVSYDPNGNILTMDANDQIGATMDQMVYQYDWIDPTDHTKGIKSNKLLHVNDYSTSTTAPTEPIQDIRDQGIFNPTSPASWNYDYDKIGNLIQDKQEEIAKIEWTAYGKIKKVIRTSTSQKSDMEFAYDATGNRIMKIEKPRTGSGLKTEDNWHYTYYMRDATRNVMGIYQMSTANPSADQYISTFKAIEYPVYACSRIGAYNPDNRTIITHSFNATISGGLFTLISNPVNTLTSGDPIKEYRITGLKYFELSNHLGNVLTTISDRKKGVDENNDGIMDYYITDIKSISDYYPFGMMMRGRNFSSSGYRYGFNGQETVDEIASGHYTAEFWEYDSRLARRWNIDPMVYTWQSSYACFNNNPIYFKDPSGLEGEEGNKEVQKHSIAKGETLTGIAKKHNTSVKTLAKWNNIKNVDKIYAGNNLIVSDPSRPSGRIEFETFKDPMPSKGSVLNPNNDWSGNGAHSGTVETDAAQDLTELLAASGRGTDIVYLYGKFINKIKSDPDMIAKENEIVASVKDQKDRFGKEAFFMTGVKNITFGGVRKDFFSTETIKAAGNSLTWGLRHADIKYWVEVSKTGIMHIEYRLSDRLDLSPNGTSIPYDIISGGMGFFYHTLGGGNINMQTRSVWRVTK